MDLGEALRCVSCASELVQNLSNLCRNKYVLMVKDFDSHPRTGSNIKMIKLFGEGKKNYKAIWNRAYDQSLREKISSFRSGEISEAALGEIKAVVNEYIKQVRVVFASLEKAVCFMSHDLELSEEIEPARVNVANGMAEYMAKAQEFQKGGFGGDGSSDPPPVNVRGALLT